MIFIIELNEGQKAGVKKGIQWYRQWKRYGYPQLFQIDGGAGTGKTTMIFKLIDELGLDFSRVLFVAYVGKAALVMRRKGLNAKTVHSALYEATVVPRTDENGEVMYDGDKMLTALKFVLRNEESLDSIDLIVVDEAGMVPEKMAKDLLSFKKPIITLGDLAQLPPVMGRRFFLSYVDHTLTEPMRQASDDPILYLATKARLGEPIDYGRYGSNCAVIPHTLVNSKSISNSDIVICAKNVTRDIINQDYRENINRYTGDIPKLGEKIICRKNNAMRVCRSGEYYLINGMVGYIEHVYRESATEKSINIDFRPEFLDEDDGYFFNLKIDREYLNTPVSAKAESDAFNKMSRNAELFEYGYAITCHLAQGSEYDKVLVYNENVGNSKFARQWLYTAITRAKKQLILAI